MRARQQIITTQDTGMAHDDTALGKCRVTGTGACIRGRHTDQALTGSMGVLPSLVNSAIGTSMAMV